MEREFTKDTLSFYKIEPDPKRKGEAIKKRLLFRLKLNKFTAFNTDQIDSYKIDLYQNYKTKQNYLIVSDDNCFIVLEPKDRQEGKYNPIVFYSDKECLGAIDSDYQTSFYTDLCYFLFTHENIKKAFNLENKHISSLIVTYNYDLVSFHRTEDVKSSKTTLEQIQTSYDKYFNKIKDERLINGEGEEKDSSTKKYGDELSEKEDRLYGLFGNILASMLVMAFVCACYKGCQMSKDKPVREGAIPMHQPTQVSKQEIKVSNQVQSQHTWA